MSTINDGGFAFPMPDRYGGANGMTLREYYAGQALAGLLASTKTSDGLTIAKDAYILADAMLRARG
jgi:hypothetical protein